MPDLPEVRTVDYGLIAAVLAKFGLDWWHGRAVKSDADAIKVDNRRLRDSMHGLRNDLNRDLGLIGTRVTRLEESEENTGERMARMEDKLDKILERMPRRA